MKGLDGRRVLVTGGVSGIGRATAERFIEEGSRVLVWDRDGPGCTALRAELPRLDGVRCVDVSDAAGVEAAFIAGHSVVIDGAEAAGGLGSGPEG